MRSIAVLLSTCLLLSSAAPVPAASSLGVLGTARESRPSGLEQQALGPAIVLAFHPPRNRLVAGLILMIMTPETLHAQTAVGSAQSDLFNWLLPVIIVGMVWTPRFWKRKAKISPLEERELARQRVRREAQQFQILQNAAQSRSSLEELLVEAWGKKQTHMAVIQSRLIYICVQDGGLRHVRDLYKVPGLNTKNRARLLIECLERKAASARATSPEERELERWQAKVEEQQFRILKRAAENVESLEELLKTAWGKKKNDKEVVLAARVIYSGIKDGKVKSIRNLYALSHMDKGRAQRLIDHLERQALITYHFEVDDPSQYDELEKQARQLKKVSEVHQDRVETSLFSRAEEFLGSQRTAIERVWVGRSADGDVAGFQILSRGTAELRLPILRTLAEQGLVENLLVVSPEAQRKGLGGSMIHAGLRYAREHQVRYIFMAIPARDPSGFRLLYQAARAQQMDVRYMGTVDVEKEDLFLVDTFPDRPTLFPWVTGLRLMRGEVSDADEMLRKNGLFEFTAGLLNERLKMSMPIAFFVLSLMSSIFAHVDSQKQSDPDTTQLLQRAA